MADKILIAHGGGGLLSAQLIRTEILPRFGNDALNSLPDAAALNLDGGKILFSTDSFVVQPLEFPGGNIGDLAVYGTVNDLAVAGGRPRYLSLGLILEEGLPLPLLRRVLDSVKKAIDLCAVQIVTGDIKVVGPGQADGIYINTAGIGAAIPGFNLDLARISPGDKVLVSGTLAEHGAAVLTVRENINFSSTLKSDSAPVHRLVQALQPEADAVKFMRDPTRGGVAAVLNEIVAGRGFGITINEAALPVTPEVRAVADLLGLEILHLASEGRVLAVCAEAAAGTVLSAWRQRPEGAGARIIGEITASDPGLVVLVTAIGGKRLMAPPHGELLPRIC